MTQTRSVSRAEALDDHRSVVNAYGAEMGRRLAATVLIAGLGLISVTSVIGLVDKWNGRFERIFQPQPGLSYDAPPMVGGQPILRIETPLAFQRLAANDAFRFNASVPVSTTPNAAAAPFVLPAMDAQGRDRALYCLTSAVYYEAASEGRLGQEAVAQVVLNRLRHPAFPKTVCGVVFSGSERRTGCQFTFTCDGARARPPSLDGWSRARSVAQAALSGHVATAVGTATHYHTLWVAPYWSPSLVKVANIGAHTFYRWGGSAGLPGAFRAAHAGFEPPIPSWRGRPAQIEVAPKGEFGSPSPVSSLEIASPAPATDSPSVSALPPPAEREPDPVSLPPAVAPPPAKAVPEATPAAPARTPQRGPRLATPNW